MSGLLCTLVGLVIGYTMALGLVAFVISVYQYRNKSVPKVLLGIAKKGY